MEVGCDRHRVLNVFPRAIFRRSHNGRPRIFGENLWGHDVDTLLCPRFVLATYLETSQMLLLKDPRLAIFRARCGVVYAVKPKQDLVKWVRVSLRQHLAALARSRLPIEWSASRLTIRAQRYFPQRVSTRSASVSKLEQRFRSMLPTRLLASCSLGRKATPARRYSRTTLSPRSTGDARLCSVCKAKRGREMPCEL